MSNRAESLAMLTAHGINPLNVPGGHSDFSPLDLAAGMSRLSDCEYSLLAAKYLLDKTAKHKTWAYWFAFLVDTKIEMSWDVPQGSIEKLATETLNEHIDEPRCKPCGGNKGSVENNKWEVCEACDGRGFRAMTDKGVCRKIKVKYSKEWVARLSWCRAQLALWESNALSAIRQ